MRRSSSKKISLSFLALASIVILFVVTIVSITAPLIAPYDPTEINMSNRLASFSVEHVLGTDHLGRDLLSRLIYGGRMTLFLALFASLLTMMIGLLVGTIAGYFGGIIDEGMQFFVNLFQGLPGISFMLAIVGVLGPGVKSLLIAIVITSWADFSRMVRGEVLKIREQHYIEAVTALGASKWYIIVNYVIPNLLGPVIVLFTVRIGRMMLAIAALSFLGLGLQPPLPDWGVMVNDARSYFRSQPSLVIFPGLCVAIVSLAVNLLGDELRDLLDSRNEIDRLD